MDNSVARDSGLVDCTYLVAEQDNENFTCLQLRVFDRANQEPGGKPSRLEQRDPSHSARLTQVPTIVRLIEDAAGAWNS